MLKILDTIYRGLAFRSRLHARWAVFLQEANIAWEHEPTVFQTSRGALMPTFWLPHYQTWVSVVPPGFQHETSLEWLAGCELAVEQGSSFMLVIGDPLDVFNSITAEAKDRGQRLWYVKDRGMSTGAQDLCREMHRDLLRDYSNMQCAAFSARQARFESDPA